MIGRLILMTLLGLGLLKSDVPLQRGLGIELSAEPVIEAGEAWSLHVSMPDSAPGTEVRAILLNGLSRLDETLILGTGGVAIWHILPGRLTQAGVTLAIVRDGEREARRSLLVNPASVNHLDFFTTANNLMAYGEGSAMLILLPFDRWGNAPSPGLEVAADLQFPAGARASLPLSYVNGLAWAEMHSQGGPGRVRILAELDNAEASLELNQTPGIAAELVLRLAPDCVLNDGRDRVTLLAEVRDSHGNAVVDGTQVIFSWRGGQGYGQTIEGQAALRLPSPINAGRYKYRAGAQDRFSPAAELKVVAGQCENE